MFPDSFGAVLGFLYVIAPGLVFDRLRSRQRPTAERSAFRETADVALASLLCAVGAIAVLWLARVFLPRALPDPQSWLTQGSHYLSIHFREAVTFFIAWAILAFGIAFGAARFMQGDQPAVIEPNTTGWFEVFRRRLPPDTYPMALVQLEDKSEFVGEVIYYDVADFTGNREITLGPPLWRKSPDETELKPLPSADGWRRVVIPGSRVATVWVRYPRRSA